MNINIKYTTTTVQVTGSESSLDTYHRHNCPLSGVSWRNYFGITIPTELETKLETAYQDAKKVADCRVCGGTGTNSEDTGPMECASCGGTGEN